MCTTKPQKPPDARLAAVLMAWSMLIEAVRAGIVAMVRVSQASQAEQ